MGLFYVGHGLHEHSDAPTLIKEARADGVAIEKIANGETVAVTASPDGKTVYYFGPRESVGWFGTEAYLGKLSAPGAKQ
jgi:hypothetical protein